MHKQQAAEAKIITVIVTLTQPARPESATSKEIVCLKQLAHGVVVLCMLLAAPFPTEEIEDRPMWPRLPGNLLRVVLFYTYLVLFEFGRGSQLICIALFLCLNPSMEVVVGGPTIVLVWTVITLLRIQI